MSMIHVLDEHLSNMIAAGEVVERPANVVKECVENSIDAQAASITIDVYDGGITGLVITDDGIGMDYEDTRLAFERHATSKLLTQDDLFNISTMGFRGEALASIASVARVEMRTNNGAESSLICYEYGQLKNYEKIEAPRGTRIEVRGLFLKTPARLKYLKKPAYEFSIIADLVNKLAACHPDIRFKLTHNGNTVFQTRGNGSLKEIVYNLYGREVAASSELFENQDEDFTISGVAVQPKITRATKYFIYLSINQRLVRSSQIQNAVIDAYGEYMPPNRYPILIMDIQVDPQLIDVNVHPNKWEIKVAKQQELIQLILNTISQLFKKKLETAAVKPKPKYFEQPTFQEAAAQPAQKPSAAVQENPLPIRSPSGHPALKDYRPNNYRQSLQFNEEHNIQRVDDRFKNPKVTFKVEEEKVSYPIPPAQPSKTRGHDFFNHLVLIGQLLDCYILCQNEEGLVVIDQHAAAERYNFEKIQKQLEYPCRQKTIRMVPLQVKVTSDIMSSLDELNEATRFFGLEFEPFSQTSLILREVPLWFEGIDEQAFVQDLLDYYASEKEVDMAKLKRHMNATLACHSSIRFHRHLSREEMLQVIEDLKKCEQPYHCPHGRPTVITMSDQDLLREFERG